MTAWYRLFLICLIIKGLALSPNYTRLAIVTVTAIVAETISIEKVFLIPSIRQMCPSVALCPFRWHSKRGRKSSVRCVRTRFTPGSRLCAALRLNQPEVRFLVRGSQAGMEDKIHAWREDVLCFSSSRMCVTTRLPHKARNVWQPTLRSLTDSFPE